MAAAVSKAERSQRTKQALLDVAESCLPSGTMLIP